MSDSNFNDILQQVKNLKKEITFYSPTSDKEYKIYPLSLKQQKEILENSFSSTLSLLFFNNCIFKIIKENFNGNIEDLDTVDRVSISLSFRNKIDNIYKEGDTEINLSEIIEKNKLPVTFNSKEVVCNEFTFKLKKPNLVLDNKINNIILRKYKSDKITEDNINNTVKILNEIDSDNFKEVFSYINALRDIENNLTKIPNSNDSISLTPDFFIVQ